MTKDKKMMQFFYEQCELAWWKCAAMQFAVLEARAETEFQLAITVVCSHGT